MDIFDLLNMVIKRKTEFVKSGINENDALDKAEIAVSKEYNISLNDIKKLYKSGIYSIL